MPVDVSPAEVFKLIESNKPLFLVDVREPGEYRREHVAQAVLFPCSALEPTKVVEAAQKKDIYVMCLSGGRSSGASKKIEEAVKASSGAHTNTVYNVTGGISSWRAANLPVVEDKKAPLPIIRQVHIIASSLVISGALLGRFFHPNFFFLPLFVGCGLMISGVTGFCGMALILAKLPYNK